MKRIIFSLIFLLHMTAASLAQDTVILKNGDVLTGEIVEQSSNHVYFKSPIFGSISLNPNDIAEITVTNKETNELNEQEEAPTENGPEAGNLPTIGTEKPAPAMEANPDPQPKKQWSGQAGLAIAMREKTSSNQNGVYNNEKYETYRLYGHVNWQGDRNALRWDWTYRYSEDEYRIRDDFFNVTQKYNHSFKNQNLFATAKTLYQRDYNRRIENEYLQTAELGINWFDTDSKLKLSTSAGGGYHAYDRIDTARMNTTKFSAPKFIFDEKLNWMILQSRELEVIQKYTHLGDLDNYHFVFSVGLQNKLVRDLFLRVEYRLDKDTEVFYDDRGYYDKALLTSLVYKF